MPAGPIYIGGMAETILQKNQVFSYHFRPPPWDEATLDKARSLVNDGNYWAAVYIPQGTSANLNASLFGGVKPYVNPVSFMYDEGRQATMVAIIRGRVRTDLAIVNAVLANAILTMMSRVPFAFNLSNTDFSAIFNPLQVVDYNLHPASLYGLSFSTFFGNILMYIMALSTVAVVLALTSKLQNKVNSKMLLRLRLIHWFFTGLLMSLTYAVIIVIFNSGTNTSSSSNSTPFNIYPDHSFNFAALWFFCWLVMSTFASIIAFIQITMGPTGQILLTLFMVTQLVSSTGLLPTEVMPPFFHIGPGLPMYHAVTGCKTIFFGSWNNIGVNLGALFAYLAAFTGLTFASIHWEWGKWFDRSTPEMTKTITQSLSGSSTDVGFAVPIIF